MSKTAAQAHARLHGRPLPPDEPETRRLTPTERLHEVTMAAMSRRPATPESSVEIVRNTKGYNFTVKVSAGDAERAYDQAVALTDKLEARYPNEPGPVTNGGTE